MTPRERHLMQCYLLTLKRWQKIFDHQHGRCAICSNRLKKANTDHDHATGEVRGLLCARCNRALGRFGDSLALLRAAVAYLIDPPARAALGGIHIGRPGRIGTKKMRALIRKEKKLLTQIRQPIPVSV